MASDAHSTPPGEIGRPLPRAETKRLVAGRGCYVDDITLPRQLHAAFLRSPFPHARIVSIDTSQARGATRCRGGVHGLDLSAACKPMQCVTGAAPGLVSPPQHQLAPQVTYQGEPIVIAVAASRAVAEDAIELIGVEWEVELPAVTVSGAGARRRAAGPRCAVVQYCAADHWMRHGRHRGGVL